MFIDDYDAGMMFEPAVLLVKSEFKSHMSETKQKNSWFDRFSRREQLTLGIAIALVVLVLCILLFWWCMPFFSRLAMDPTYRAAFRNWISSLGVGGFFVMLGIQIAQILIPFLPGEVVQIIAGVLYGTWGGLALCVSGCVLASAFVFWLVRKLERPFIERLFGRDTVENWALVHNTARVEKLTFILFLIPGMPKDLLTYIVPLSNIRMRTFMILTTLARIPGMMASTLIGSNIYSGRWMMTLGLFVIFGVIGLCGIILKDKIIKYFKYANNIPTE